MFHHLLKDLPNLDVTHQPPWADLAGAVAALAGQVLPMSQDAGGPSALEGQTGVDEGGGSAVMVHEERLYDIMTWINSGLD